MMCPGTWGYDNTITRPSYDPAKAKQFLIDGGKPSGFTVDLGTTNSADQTLESQMIQANLAAIGISMNIKLYDNATVTSKFFTTTEFPIYLTTWSRKLDPDALAYIYTSTGVYNAAKIGNPQIDALVAKGSAEYDQQKRFAIYHQINQMVTDDAWFTVGLYGQSYIG